MECTNCALEERVSQLEAGMKKNSDQHREFYERLGTEEKATTAQGKDLEYIKQGVDDLKKSVASLEKKPGKHWESVKTAILAALASGLIGFLLAQLLGR